MSLTQKERSALFYKNRRNNGLCPRCGKKLDRKGHYCSECLKKVSQYNRENKKFYRDNGICPVCRKEKVFGDEKQCISCRQKAYERRKPLTDEQKERYGSHFRKQQNSLYRERAENGICTRCGKRTAEKGKKKCRICLDKDAEIHRKLLYKRNKIREYREENNLCYYCGQKVESLNGRLCHSCRERCVQAGLKSGGGNEYWKNDNKIAFENGRKD